MYPLAELEIEIGGSVFAIEAGVTDHLPVSVFSGKEVPILTQMLKQPRDSKVTDALVVTRAQAKRQMSEELLIEEREKQSRAETKLVEEDAECGTEKETGEETAGEQSVEPDRASSEYFTDLNEELFQGGQEKEKQSRSKKKSRSLGYIFTGVAATTRTRRDLSVCETGSSRRDYFSRKGILQEGGTDIQMVDTP